MTSGAKWTLYVDTIRGCVHSTVMADGLNSTRDRLTWSRVSDYMRVRVYGVSGSKTSRKTSRYLLFYAPMLWKILKSLTFIHMTNRFVLVSYLGCPATNHRRPLFLFTEKLETILGLSPYWISIFTSIITEINAAVHLQTFDNQWHAKFHTKIYKNKRVILASYIPFLDIDCVNKRLCRIVSAASILFLLKCDLMNNEVNESVTISRSVKSLAHLFT